VEIKPPAAEPATAKRRASDTSAIMIAA